MPPLRTANRPRSSTAKVSSSPSTSSVRGARPRRVAARPASAPLDSTSGGACSWRKALGSRATASPSKRVRRSMVGMRPSVTGSEPGCKGVLASGGVEAGCAGGSLARARLPHGVEHDAQDQDRHQRDGCRGLLDKRCENEGHEDDDGAEDSENQQRGARPGLAADARWADAISAKTHNAIAVPPIEAIELRSKPSRKDDRGWLQSPGCPSGPALLETVPPKVGRELALLRPSPRTNPAAGYKPGVRSAGCREQRGDGHQPVPRLVPETGSAATASAVPPELTTSPTVRVPNTPSATAT